MIRRLLIPVISVLLLPLLVSCSKIGSFDRGSALEIKLSVLGMNMSTKADIGDVAVVSDEDKIVSAQVWAFASGAASTETALSYKSATGGNSSSMSLLLEFSDDAKTAAAGKYLDFYVIANRLGAIGDGSALTMTKAQIEALALGTSDFGTSDPVVGSVPTTGLPMAMKTTSSEVIVDTTPKLVVESQGIVLRRAVSKIRFCVARKTGLENVQILGFTIDDQMIPAQEYLMPQADVRTANIVGTEYSAGFSYSSTLSTSSIPEQSSEDLAGLVYSTWAAAHPSGTAQDYDDAISAATAEYGRTYLRESDKAISGTVRYSTDGGTTTVSAPFQLVEAGDFVRNHSVIVYLYFEELKLFVKPTVVRNWEKGDHLVFSTEASTEFNVNQSSYKLYDADGYPTDWKNAYAAVAYGVDSNGMPLYSPLLKLKTTSTYSIQLQCDNGDFGFVVRTGVLGEYVYSSTQGSVTIPSNGGTEQTTYFYVVPTHLFNFASTNPPSRYAAISMIEATSETIGNLLPFNASVFPGSSDSTEGYFYYMTPTEYNSSAVVDQNVS